MRNIDVMDRPDHPDFWAISRTLIAHDEIADKGGFIKELGMEMDEDLLMELALIKGANGVKSLSDQNGDMLKFMTMWLIGFTDGVKCYQDDTSEMSKTDFSGPDLLGIDGASLTYAASQRAIRAMLESSFTIPAAATAWLDGFMTGVDLENHRE